MKKITYIANIRLPTEKAHGLQIMKMCEAFSNEGYEVELVVPERKTPIKETPFNYYGVKENFKIKRLGSVDFVKFGKAGFLIQSFIFSIRVSFYVLFRKGIFYTRDEFEALFLKIIGKKVIWEVHMGQVNIFARILLLLHIPLITITDKLKHLYTTLGVRESNILVAHDAVDINEFENLPSKNELRKSIGLPEDKIIISYIGKFKTLGKTKGVEDIVKPFAENYPHHPNLLLLVVGPEPEEVVELEALLIETKIPKDAYKIVGHVEHKLTPHYMKVSDILLMMYPNTKHYALYMSPLKLFEYMASGTPILASRLPSLEEILNDQNAYFFEPDDINSFKQKLSFIIENQIESLKKGVQAAQDVKEYTWEKRAKSIINFTQMQ